MCNKMKNIISFTIFALLLTGGYGQDTTTVPSTTPSDTTPSETTTPATTTPATTAEDTTVTDFTTQPTTQSPIPTTPPTTVTPTKKTTPVPVTTTPAVTTVAPSTTTKAPAPPVPDLGSWNISCIRADLKIRFMIPVNGHDDYIALSPNASSDGSKCTSTTSNTTQELILTDADYVLTMIFEKDAENVYLKNITFSYTLPEGTGFVYNDSSLFKVKLHNSYLCTNTENVPLQNVTMEIFQIHVQAFGTAGGDFGVAEECEADNKVNDIVPIAVGCALLALVVVVLIAYFVGRRRSRQKGYQSV